MLALVTMTAWAQGGTLPPDYEPCAVSDFTGRWVVADGKNNIEMSFTTPTQMRKYDNNIFDYVYEDLSADITKIDVQRSAFDQYNFRTIKTFTNPEKGVTLTCTDENLSYGRYDYRVVVYVDKVSSFLWNWDAIKTFSVGDVPANFQDDDISGKSDGSDVIITVKAPALSTVGDAITMPLTITLFEAAATEPPTYNTVRKIENVTPGESFDIILNGISDGNHAYTIQASTEAGSNSMYGLMVLVGKDYPGTVVNAKAKETEDGILVTWDAPVIGMQGGDQGDIEAMTYTVIRKNNAYDIGEVAAQGLTTRSFTDNITADEERIVIYDIYATNATGDGHTVSTSPLVIGPASAMPYKEGFDADGEFDHATWLKTYSGNYCAWYAMNTNASPFYVKNAIVKAHSGSGLAYAMYDSFFNSNQWDAITTGHIDMSAAEWPALSLWYYDLANGGSDLTLSIEATTDDGETYTSVKELALGSAEQNGWQNLVVAMPYLAGQPKVQLRIRSIVSGKNCYPVVIDELLISDDPSVGIHDITTLRPSSAAYTISGQRAAANYKGIVIINGKKVVK